MEAVKYPLLCTAWPCCVRVVGQRLLTVFRALHLVHNLVSITAHIVYPSTVTVRPVSSPHPSPLECLSVANGCRMDGRWTAKQARHKALPTSHQF